MFKDIAHKTAPIEDVGLLRTAFGYYKFQLIMHNLLLSILSNAFSKWRYMLV